MSHRLMSKLLRPPFAKSRQQLPHGAAMQGQMADENDFDLLVSDRAPKSFKLVRPGTPIEHQAGFFGNDEVRCGDALIVAWN